MVCLIEITLLVVFFLMLWVPFGQQDFLVEHWMKVGAYLAPILLFFSIRGSMQAKDSWLRQPRLMACVLTSIYLIHQVEEHWVDLLGRVYPLYDLLNGLLRDQIDESAYGAMTPETIFFINTSLVWLPGLLAIWRAPKHVFPMLAMAGIVLVNGVAHVGQGLFTWSYNPGLLTAVLLFIPISLIAYFVFMKSDNVGRLQIASSIAWGIGGHVLLFAGLLASSVYGIMPVEMYYALLIGWALVPLFMFLPCKAQKYAPYSATA